MNAYRFGNQNARKHGYAGRKHQHAIYKIWNGIKNRCYNPNEPKYQYYGGRGIQVCQRWRESFEAFLEDMGPRPSPKHQLDRFPDNNGDYRPGNCRWVLRTLNMRNKRNNHRLFFNDKNLCICEWAELTGINRNTISGRLARGWSIELALTTSVIPNSQRSQNFRGARPHPETANPGATVGPGVTGSRNDEDLTERP